MTDIQPNGLGRNNSATILRFPSSRTRTIRVEPEFGGFGWMVLAPNGHGWLHGDRDAALLDAHEVASGFGVTVRSC
jgi:hypothetical protein